MRRIRNILKTGFIIIALTAISALLVFGFIIEPYSIPTNSMSPTLRGPQVLSADPYSTYDLKRWVINGERRLQVLALAGGAIVNEFHPNMKGYFFSINGIEHVVPKGFATHIRPGEMVLEGQLLADGVTKSADRVLVNRLAYTKRPPERGDIVVFNTEGLNSSHVDPSHRFVKRIVGLPGENIQIDEPYLLINGEKLLTPEIFRRISSAENNYKGFKYANPLSVPSPILYDADAMIILENDEYLVMGDNPDVSFDGRFFGPIRRSQIIGKALRIYWPKDRTGLIE